MGNYESLRTSASIEFNLDDANQSLEDAVPLLDSMLDKALAADLKEAAVLTDVRNSYVLTWLDRRDSE